MRVSSTKPRETYAVKQITEAEYFLARLPSSYTDIRNNALPQTSHIPFKERQSIVHKQNIWS